ncbi:LysR family transcriptional regulator [Cohnella lupini]|uniref:DNA-binding transcriptional LysR family regulator n=1 Tax=Cohnella lupini TaxID=1294267 RepID=A0A3D9IQA8_9BACL|nr:LysR family transcriptional regulator [Cohnella lupini]RED63942.1 DNA-binding transcriptional LysR family regulator [Cohnella lupini]
MNVQQLRAFLSVCTGSTLLETADKLGLKQPTVSFHLRKLEETLDAELWHKNGRGFRPTRIADTLLPYARKIVALVDEAELRVSEHRDKHGGQLRIGASHTPATYLIPPYLAEFRKKHPNLQLLLTVKKAASAIEMLSAHEVDAVIASLPETAEPEGMTVRPLVEDELRLFLSPEHPLAFVDQVTIDQLKSETFLLHEQGTTSRQLSDRWGEQVGLNFHQAMEMGAIETIKEGLKCNMGVAVLPWRSAARDAEAGLLVEKPLPGYRNNRYICLVYRDEEILSPHLRLFIDFIQARLAMEKGSIPMLS